MLFNAPAEADQLTIFKSLAPAGNLPAVDQGAAGWALLEVQARRLVSSVIDTLAKMPAGNADAPVSNASATASCPGQQWKRDRATNTMTRMDRPPVAIPLQVLRVGDLALAGVGGTWTQPSECQSRVRGWPPTPWSSRCWQGRWGIFFPMRATIIRGMGSMVHR